MNTMKIEFEKQERAIELPDGTILDIPERTKANDDKIQSVLQTRAKRKEYDFLIAVLEALFGKNGVKQIVPDVKNANMDYLTAVYITAVNAFYADKQDAERVQMQRRVDELDPLADKLKSINPLMSRMK